jgi:hypothetical protein
MTENLVPIQIPKHPERSVEEVFDSIRKNYFFNLDSAFERKWDKLICNTRGRYRKVDKHTKCFSFKLNNKRKKISIHWLVLFNVFPEKTPEDVWGSELDRKRHHLIPKWTVDHINNIHNDNHPDNLRWMTRLDHAKLEGRSYKDVKRQSHADKDLFDDEYEIYNESDIFKNLSVKYKLPPLARIKVTNRGRVKLPSGKYNRGYLKYLREHHHDGTTRRVLTNRYRRVKIGRKEFTVHTLIMMAKLNQEIPKGYVVMHNDTIPTTERLDEEGAERNWVDDLTVGTLSENMKSYYENRISNKLEVEFLTA